MLFFYFIFSETKLLQDDILHIQPYSLVYSLPANAERRKSLKRFS